MSTSEEHPYVSRGGLKLAAALDAFEIAPAAWVCADLGSNVGGFVDVLLRRGAAKVYTVDTGYGTLAWSLRKDPRVVVMERSNAMHVKLAEPVDLVTIDVAWTPQQRILPAAARLLRPGGRIVTLIKPHYEADRSLLDAGVLPAEQCEAVVRQVCDRAAASGLRIERLMESPVLGGKGNREYLALIGSPGKSPASLTTSV